MQKAAGLLLILAAGCALSSGVPSPESGQAKFTGFGTFCRGQLLFVRPDGRAGGESLIAPAGAVDLKVWHESEADFSPDYPSLDFMCRYQSLHRVRFRAEPGKLYRLQSSQTAEGRFVIAVFEVREPGLPDAEGIAADSEQLSAKRICGFSECARDFF